MGGVAIFEFIETVVERGIEAVRQDYAKDPDRLEGAIAGFESCRGKSVDEILAAYKDANEEANRIHMTGEIDGYWGACCKALEIEWTLNCLSAALRTSLLSWLPTARAVMLAGEILGVAPAPAPSADEDDHAQ